MKTANYLNVQITNKEINDNVNFEGSDLRIYSLNTKKVGYGHFQLSLQVELDDEPMIFSEVTTDTLMIDNMTEDDDKVSDEAIKTAVLWVLNRTELEAEEF